MTKTQQQTFDKMVTETATLRKRITMYKKAYTELALFRTQATNNILKMYELVAINKPFTKQLQAWVEFWDDGSDLGNDIQKFVKAINSYRRK